MFFHSKKSYKILKTERAVPHAKSHYKLLQLIFIAFLRKKIFARRKNFRPQRRKIAAF